MPRRIALATAAAARAGDDDFAPLAAALGELGLVAEAVDWDDPAVDWACFEAVLPRSTWDYVERLDEFLDWCERVAQATRFLNPPTLLRWNTDKRYLLDLAAAGVAVVESHFIAPGQPARDFPDHGEFVVKPAVGAGARDARRFTRTERDLAVEHARALLERGRTVLVQPYLPAVDQAGETALIHFEGAYSHAIRKGPLLPRHGPASPALFAPESISPRQPSEAERALAARAVAAIPGGAPLYARIDLLPSADGPRLLELELTEPSLFFAHAPGSAARMARALARRLVGEGGS